MSRLRKVGLLLAAPLLAALGMQLVGLPGAGAVNAQHDRVVNAVPGSNTPHAVDGRVFAITQVGSYIVMGGSFTQVQPPNRSTTYALPYVIAFDAATGQVNTAFAPGLDGTVETVLPGPTAGTVYVGGSFKTARGATAKGLVLLNVANGNRVAGFATIPMNGVVQSVKRVGNRLFVGGTFTTIGGQARGGIASLNATTGAVDSFLTSQVLTNHNWTPERGGAKAGIGVNKLDVTPDGSRLVAIGNFKTVDGLPRDQVAMWDLTGATAVVRADWRTRGYEAACFYWAYDTYVRDVDISPDGAYFVIATTGGGNTTLCDTAARFEIAGSGDDVRPTWVAYTGGDSLLSVAITGEAVYVGGHQRWMNNPAASDRAGGGAVPRPGIAALDPGSGMPLTWNPGRNPRGAGAYALFANAGGLYVGSDTDWIGDYDYRRMKIAYFPLAGGAPVASDATGTLPGGVYLGQPQGGSGLVERNFDGSAAGGVNPVASPLDFGTVTGATLIGGTLYYGKTDGLLYRRTFSGTAFGAEALVDPYNDPYWSTVDTGSNSVFRGARPSFYGTEIQNLTSLFYDGAGRLYYTLNGQSTLYSRQFSPDSGIVHNTRGTVGTLADAGGAFLVGDQLYFVQRSTGNLARIAWVNRAPSGAATVVSGPGVDGVDWRARAVFLGPGVGLNQPPTARLSVSCSALSCSATGTASSDPDGTVTGYAWTWGDGATTVGATSSHTFGAAGTYTVRLTVTDDDGATGTATQTVTVAQPPASSIAFRGASAANANSSRPTVTVPASVQAGDALVLFVSTKPGTTQTPPAGWTAVGSLSGASVQTRVWQRTAVAGDAGSAVPVTLSELTKADLRIAAYSGTAATNPVTATLSTEATTGTTHTVPGVTVGTPGSWVVWYWADKSGATTTAWTPPPGSTSRGASYGTGTTYLSSLIADPGAASPVGSVPGPTAATNAASRGNGVTLVLRPA